MNRVSAENKRLTEMLMVVCENYNALRSQVMEYMSKNAEKLPDLSPSRKRKSESSNNDRIDNSAAVANGASESSSTDEGSPKRPREEKITEKISRLCVRTEQSDTGLVSIGPLDSGILRDVFIRLHELMVCNFCRL